MSFSELGWVGDGVRGEHFGIIKRQFVSFFVCMCVREFKVVIKIIIMINIKTDGRL